MMYEKFLEELRLEYDRRVTTSESLTKKSSDLMTISGIVAALITGFFGSFVSLEQLQTNYLLYLVLIGVGLLISTVGLCAGLNKVESQRTPFMGRNMIKGSKTDFKIVNSWVKQNEENYYEALIDEYVQCMKEAEKTNEIKSKWINRSLGVFIAGLSILPISLLIGFVLPISLTPISSN